MIPLLRIHLHLKTASVHLTPTTAASENWSCGKVLVYEIMRCEI